jgi:transposase-like protein
MGRKKYSKELKARIALDATKDQKTVAELASELEFTRIRLKYGRSGYLMQLLLLLAAGKREMVSRKKLSKTICIKRSANCKSKLIG